MFEHRRQGARARGAGPSRVRLALLAAVMAAIMGAIPAFAAAGGPQNARTSPAVEAKPILTFLHTSLGRELVASPQVHSWVAQNADRRALSLTSKNSGNLQPVSAKVLLRRLASINSLAASVSPPSQETAFLGSDYVQAFVVALSAWAESSSGANAIRQLATQAGPWLYDDCLFTCILKVVGGVAAIAGGVIAAVGECVVGGVVTLGAACVAAGFTAVGAVVGGGLLIADGISGLAANPSNDAADGTGSITSVTCSAAPPTPGCQVNASFVRPNVLASSVFLSVRYYDSPKYPGFDGGPGGDYTPVNFGSGGIVTTRIGETPYSFCSTHVIAYGTVNWSDGKYTNLPPFPTVQTPDPTTCR